MRLSYVVLVVVLSSISTASGEVGLNQPQLPAARSVDTALWSESVGVAKRTLRSHDDTDDKNELDVADADDEERGAEFLKKMNPAKWVKTKWTNHKLRQAAKLAENQRRFKQDMETMALLQTNYYDKWNKLGMNKEQAKIDLINNKAPKEAIDDILHWFTPIKKAAE